MSEDTIARLISGLEELRAMCNSVADERDRYKLALEHIRDIIESELRGDVAQEDIATAIKVAFRVPEIQRKEDHGS